MSTARGRWGVHRAAGLILTVALAAAACSDSDTDTFVDNVGELVDEATERVATSDGQLAGDIGSYRPADCEFESEVFPAPECGWLTVPMVRAADGSAVDERTIDIHVATFGAWDRTSRDDPIVYLEGGPGVSALGEADLTVEWLWRLNAERDLILFDQRGLGASTPGLRCPEVDAAWAKLPVDATEELSIERERAAATACRARLEDDGVEVSAYDTLSAAHDVADLRVALGIDEWNVLGVSYGTRLGQTLVRERPEGIRSIILDASYPLDDDPLFSVPRTGAAALDRLFDACDSDPGCRQAHPDFERRFRAMVAALDERPLDVNFGSEDDPWVFPVDGSDVVDAATGALYDLYAFVDLPRLVDTYEAGEDWGIASFVGGPIGGIGDGEELGTFLSVNCRDEVSFSAPPPPVPDHLLAGDHDQYVDDTLAACEIWDVGQAPAVENEPVHSDLPSLVLVGSFDPITPVEHGMAVADTFTASTFVEFGDRGHGSLGDECADDIALAFLDSPRDELDLRCVADLDGPQFVPTGPGDLSLGEVHTSGDPSISSLAPLAWIENEDGWLRDRSLLDFTSLLVEGNVDSTVDTELEAALSFYGPKVRRRSITDRAGVDWVVLDVVHLSDHLDVAMAEFDGTVIVVTLTTGVDERADIVDAILLDVLTATRSM